MTLPLLAVVVVFPHIHTYTGARSDLEALASTPLELHGLQDMLGSLWEWVAEAEGRMTETEATPIGENSRQLNNGLQNTR